MMIWQPKVGDRVIFQPVEKILSDPDYGKSGTISKIRKRKNTFDEYQVRIDGAQEGVIRYAILYDLKPYVETAEL